MNTWPSAVDYKDALQHPPLAFEDPLLQAGKVETNKMGVPRARAGNFANVYKMECPGDQTWAIKCFTRPVADLQERYARISEHLEKNRRRFAVAACLSEKNRIKFYKHASHRH